MRIAAFLDAVMFLVVYMQQGLMLSSTEAGIMGEKYLAALLPN